MSNSSLGTVAHLIIASKQTLPPDKRFPYRSSGFSPGEPILPLTAHELSDMGVSAQRRRTQYEKCTTRTYLPRLPERSKTRAQPTKKFQHSHIIRTIGHVRTHPNHIPADITALMLHGVEYFGDDLCICFLSPFSPKNDVRSGVYLRQNSGQELMNLGPIAVPDLHQPTLDLGVPTVRPKIAAGQFLTSVARGIHTWRTPNLRGFTAREVRIIQGADAITDHFCLGMDIWSQVPGLSSATRKLIQTHGAGGAESPMETVLRLIVASVLPTVRSQVKIPLQGIHTVADLADPVAKIAIYYDGATHDLAPRRATDSKINVLLTGKGWRVLRFTKEHLRDPGWVRAQVLECVRSGEV